MVDIKNPIPASLIATHEAPFVSPFCSAFLSVPVRPIVGWPCHPALPIRVSCSALFDRLHRSPAFERTKAGPAMLHLGRSDRIPFATGRALERDLIASAGPWLSGGPSIGTQARTKARFPVRPFRERRPTFQAGKGGLLVWAGSRPTAANERAKGPRLARTWLWGELDTADFAGRHTSIVHANSVDSKATPGLPPRPSGGG